MAAETTETTAAACRYLLVLLLQRLEGAHPGLLGEMQTGAEADRRALPPEHAASEVAATLEEALRIMRLAKAG